MAKVLSLDIRRRIIGYVSAGHSCREAALRYEVAPSIAIKLVSAHRRTGSYVPRPRGGWRHSKLDPHRAFLEKRIAEQPDLTMRELAEEMSERGVVVAPALLSRWLIRHGYRYKKNAAGVGTRSARHQSGA